MQLEFDTYRQTVEKVGEEAKKIVTADTGAVCEICHKTKFADGVGHKCAYCNLKSCARCGGRMVAKNKVLYVIVSLLFLFMYNILPVHIYGSTPLRRGQI